MSAAERAGSVGSLRGAGGAVAEAASDVGATGIAASFDSDVLDDATEGGARYVGFSADSEMAGAGMDVSVGPPSGARCSALAVGDIIAWPLISVGFSPGITEGFDASAVSTTVFSRGDCLSKR